MTIRVAVVGATGTLGSAAVQLINETDDLEMVAGLRSTSSFEDMLGEAGNPSEVVLDVSLPDVSESVVDFALEHGRNVLVGTSGWSTTRLDQLKRKLDTYPDSGVIVIPNFSLGSALSTAFATVAGRFYDSVEIIEAHRARKIDSPSGTAVRTAELIQASRAERGPVEAPHTDQRARGQQVSGIPVHSLRINGVVAKQQVIVGGSGETVTITHDTLDSSAYSTGILIAIRAVTNARGLTVGLDKLIDLGIGSPAVAATGEAAS